MPKKKAKYRPAIPVNIKRGLYHEAGNKCANPGCPNKLLDLHHIQQWHVYQIHNAKHMIAICPTCHAHVHRGEIVIDEPTLRSWKQARRNPSNTGYLYIEPGLMARLLMGCCYWRHRNDNDSLIFRLSDCNYVNFRIISGNVLLVSLMLSDPTGGLIAELRENHLRHSLREGVKLESRPGRLKISVPSTDAFISLKMLEAYKTQNGPASLIVDGRVTLMDLQVLEAGVIQVEGIWTEIDRAVISHSDWLSVQLPGRGFIHYRGYGEVRGDKDLSNLPTICFDGPLDISVFRAAFQNLSF